jgi:DMSO/TMAO reductase YedYZ molybdopterin-dependent catalytic subunit
MSLPPDSPPPGPFRPGFWRSPLRGPWLTSLLGSLLAPLLSVIAVTGLLSQIAYLPDLGANAIVPAAGDLLPAWGWPTSPVWLYRVTQGLHVTVGIVTVPLLLAKLWSVIPRLFAWPPVRSPAMALERLSIALLVGSALFEFATGIANVQYWYPFHFNFVVAHYWGAWVFIGALVVHVLTKLPVIARAYREQGVLRPLKADLAHTRPEPPDPDGLVPTAPAQPTISRRGLLGLVGGSSLALAAVTVGQTIDPLRATALLAPRRQEPGGGPNGFQVNKTARAAGITPEMAGAAWRLELRGGDRELALGRDELLAMELATHELPIACVEGWSTSQRWTGVRLADLAALVGGAGRACTVESLQERGVLRRATLAANQVGDERSLLALRVNGADLSPDHGYPARVIVPALPGVHNTKWVARLSFA